MRHMTQHEFAQWGVGSLALVTPITVAQARESFPGVVSLAEMDDDATLYLVHTADGTKALALVDTWTAAHTHAAQQHNLKAVYVH